jgi:hypothetical protein
MPEIDDAEYQSLVNAKKVLGDLLNSPKTSRSTQENIKTLNPGYTTDRERADWLVKEVTEETEKVLARRDKEERDKELDRRFNSDLDSYRLSKNNPNGFTDEGIEKIKTLMRERTIPDVHAAVALFEKMNPGAPDTPSGYQPTGWNFGTIDKDDADKRMLFDDPDAWADKTAREVWKEVSAGKAV